MDAVEYEKGRRRMCRTNILKKGSCEGCDAYSVLMHRCDFVPPPPGRKADDEKVIKKNIATVEQWVKDNQIKTRQSEFLKMFPRAKVRDGVISLCPQFYCITILGTDFTGCNPNDCAKCLREYWLAEVTDND